MTTTTMRPGEYEAMLQLDPKDPDALYQLGIAYLLKKQPTKAKDQYEALKFLDPGNAGKLKKLMELAEAP